jgi:hypothetical protein
MEKKTVVDEDYNKFLQLIKDKELFISNILPTHQHLKAKMRAETSMHAREMESKYPNSLKFFKWLDQQTDFNFYLVKIGQDGGISLFKSNLEDFLNIAHRTAPSNQGMQDIIGNQRAFLELQTLYSFKKGQGYKIMQKLIKLAIKINYPISLYAETESNVRYFERYGFINHGKHGDKGEYLMILMP